MKTESGEIHDHSLLTILFANRGGKSSVRKCVDADQRHIRVPFSLLFFWKLELQKKITVSQWLHA
jgi:hypothetical protein